MGDIVKLSESTGEEQPKKLCDRVVLRDDDAMRVTYFDFGAGEENEWHFHPYDFVVVTLDNGMLESLNSEGQTAKIPTVRNNFYRVPAGNRHRAKNVSNEPIRLIEIELKSTDIRTAGRATGAQRAAAPLSEVIGDLEETRRAAMLAGDADTLDGLFGEVVSYVHSNAERDDREGYLAKVRAGALRYRALEFNDLHVLNVSTDTALAAGVMRGSVDIDGKERKLNTAFTSTWLRAQGFWKLVSFHSTPIPNAA